MSATVLLAPDPLREYSKRLLLGLGVPEERAALVADSLVQSNLRGVDTHGVQLLNFYLDKIQAGAFDVAASGEIVSENGPCLTYDAQSGIGQWTASLCADHASRLALAHGMSFVTARNANHFGAAAYWASRIAARGLLAMTFCNAPPMVAPWQGKEGRFGTNPICVALPGPDIWLLDMATTTVAMGRIFRAHLNGEAEIPAGWAMDSDGVPTTSTQKAFDGLLMPLGGYKGSGLAFLVEILSGVMSGGAMSHQVGWLKYPERPMNVSHSFLAIDVSRFMPLEVFAARLAEVRDLVKSAAPATGYSEVLIAGEPEWRKEAERRVHGIPLDAGIWGRLVEWGHKLGVAAPEGISA
jgi:LDH2 family malate/lactate/ureidoglycolate dehydrogenase